MSVMHQNALAIWLVDVNSPLGCFHTSVAGVRHSEAVLLLRIVAPQFVGIDQLIASLTN